MFVVSIAFPVHCDEIIFGSRVTISYFSKHPHRIDKGFSCHSFPQRGINIDQINKSHCIIETDNSLHELCKINQIYHPLELQCNVSCNQNNTTGCLKTTYVSLDNQCYPHIVRMAKLDQKR